MTALGNLSMLVAELDGMPLVFQRGQAKDLAATYHFRFIGTEAVAATVVIKRGNLSVAEGHQGTADLTVTADSDAWLAFSGGWAQKAKM